MIQMPLTAPFSWSRSQFTSFSISRSLISVVLNDATIHESSERELLSKDEIASVSLLPSIYFGFCCLVSG